MVRRVSHKPPEMTCGIVYMTMANADDEFDGVKERRFSAGNEQCKKESSARKPIERLYRSRVKPSAVDHCNCQK